MESREVEGKVERKGFERAKGSVRILDLVVIHADSALGNGSDADLSVLQAEEGVSTYRTPGKVVDGKGREFVDDAVLANAARCLVQDSLNEEEEEAVVRLDRQDVDEQKKSGRPSVLQKEMRPSPPQSRNPSEILAKEGGKCRVPSEAEERSRRVGKDLEGNSDSKVRRNVAVVDLDRDLVASTPRTDTLVRIESY